jgi:release factor glutamine methyltransferase
VTDSPEPNPEFPAPSPVGSVPDTPAEGSGTVDGLDAGSGPVRPSRAIRAVADRLAAAGIPAARAEAEQLVASVLGVPRGRLALAADCTGVQLARIAALVARRCRHEPLQHLLGVAPFRYLELAVGPGVFVPRPETELLAGWGVDMLTTCDGEAGEPLVVDLCSGSGAIALAVANEVPTARVVAVERSPAALVWLRRNAAARAAAGDRPVEVIVGDVGDPDLLSWSAGRVALLLANPPYVPTGVPVPAEVADHDPAEAVFAGPDGLDVIRPLIGRAITLLAPGAGFGFEHDDSHAPAVVELLEATGAFVDIDSHRDLAGRPRFVTARRSR